MRNPSLKTLSAATLGAAALVAATASTHFAHADVKPNSLFSDNAVLEGGVEIPVWGTARDGENVTVQIADQKVSTIAKGGVWQVQLKPLQSADALTMTITGDNTVTAKNILVGDVWVCSGQSNMQFALNQASNATSELPKADDPQLRLFLVPGKYAVNPQTDTAGRWVLCTPATAAGFTAVGYFFGRDLRAHLKRPVGLIGSYWGGTPAQSWTSIEALQSNPPFADYVAGHKAVADPYPQQEAAYAGKMADYQAAVKQWNVDNGEAWAATMKDYNAAAAQARAAKLPPPPRPVPPKPMPLMPRDPEGGPGVASELYNGMIAPLIPYAIKGAIWYQGESNEGRGKEYATLFPRMITDWRTRWNQGDFPFLFVQLPLYRAAVDMPVQSSGWIDIRESQQKTLALPNTGMAVTIDVGDPPNIHPKDKMDVGDRLALIARHVAYGEDLVYTGPTYDSMKVEGNKIRINFKNTGSGLTISAPPWMADGSAPPVPTDITGFAISGADKKWSVGKAQIDGNSVLVWSDEVAAPTAVRYAWKTNPQADLYNKEGLPAAPFRTDMD